MKHISYIKNYFARLRFNSDAVNGMIAVKGGRPLIAPYLSIVRLAGLLVNPSWTRVVVVVLRRFHVIYLHEGLKGLVKHLKSAYVATQQAASGYIIDDMTPLGPRVSRTLSGYPRLIPAQIRDRIRSGDIKALRVMLSLFSLYRVIVYPGDLKLGSITQAYEGEDISDMYQYIPGFLSFLRRTSTPCIDVRACGRGESIYDFPKEYKGSITPRVTWNPLDRENFPIPTSGPFSSALKQGLGYVPSSGNPYSVIMSILMFSRNDSLRASLLFLANANLGILSHVQFLLHSVIGSQPLKLVGETIRDFALGKLSLKPEPAGKIRVFAIVDPLTQWVLYPLHKYIFSLLKDIPMDGTFDQSAPLKPLFGSKELYSLDLSSATDRLPITLQIKILNELIWDVPGYGEHWANLLVGRDYSVPKKGVPPVRYAVGQPMGALSSWAMLALTHHFILQYAAWTCGHPITILFSKYVYLETT